MEGMEEMEGTDLTVPVQQVWVTARVLEEQLHYARVTPPTGAHESRGPAGRVLDVDVNVPVGQQALHYEDVPLLGRDIQRGPPVFPLDVHLDILPLDELGHHHALGLVGGNAQRGLAVLVELVGVVTNSLQLVDHVGVPAERESESGTRCQVRYFTWTCQVYPGENLIPFKELLLIKIFSSIQYTVSQKQNKISTMK